MNSPKIYFTAPKEYHQIVAGLIRDKCEKNARTVTIDAREIALWDINLNFIIGVLSKNKKPEILKVLDLGCGYGFHTNAVGGLKCRTLGIDINEPAIDFAKGHNLFPKKIIFSNKAVEDLPGRKEFDAIIVSELLEHCVDPEDIVAQCKRLIKNHGIIIFTGPNGRSLRELVEMLLLPVRRTKRGPKILRKIRNIASRIVNSQITAWDIFADDYHKRFYTMNGLLSLFSKYGFILREYQNQDFTATLLGTIFPYIKFPAGLLKFDYKTADRLPYYLAGGWMMVFEQRGEYGD
jgi:2-polyprenyl-3-methyl-5-hydroxy-6-metoxy-1,4-benzoquinol methylase